MVAYHGYAKPFLSAQHIKRCMMSTPEPIHNNTLKTPSGRLLSDWRRDVQEIGWGGSASDLDALFKELQPNSEMHAQEAQRLLYATAINPRVEKLKFVLSLGVVDVNQLNTQGFTANHLAAERNQEDHCRLLLEHGANPNKPDQFQNTPLMTACKKGHMGLVRLYLEHGADISASSITGQTALTLAQAGNKTDAITALIAYGSGRYRINDEEVRVLPMAYAAARCGFTQRLLELLDGGEPTHNPRYERSVPEEAAFHGHHETANAAQAWIAKQIMLKASQSCRPNF